MSADRLILWLVLISPIFTMTGTLLLRDWMRNGFRARPAIWMGIVFACIGVFVAYDVGAQRPGYHVHLQRRELLWLLAPLFALLLVVQMKTLSGISRGRMWTAFLLRATIFNLLILAVAGLQSVVESDRLSVLFVLDSSKSVPESERQRAIEYIRRAMPAKKGTDDAGLLVFGGKAELESQPTPVFNPPDAKNIKSSVAPDNTDIALALRRGVSAFDEGALKRMVLFTDGRQTTGDCIDELKRVVSLGVDVWVVPLTRSNTAEMLVEKIVLPSELLWEQPFDAHVFVYSNVKAAARVRLYPGDSLGDPSIVKTVELVPGKNRVTFEGLKMHTGGAKEVRAVVEPLDPADDTLSENNEAYAFTDVQTDSRVLILTSDPSEIKHLVSALEGEKVTLDVRWGATLPENPEAYRAYDCIILANIGRAFFSEQQLKVMETCVKDQGAGLIMIGGDQSFGAGQYLHTPIEDALPVQMDLKNQRIMPSGALSIVLHTCEFPDGNAWGKKISKAAINALSPEDYAGLIYYGGFGGESWCFKPAKVSRKQWMFGLIDGCDPGDMPTLDPIVNMAVTSVANLNNVSLKHAIIITDGDPSPPTQATIAAAKKAKVTISAVSIFPHGGADVGLLKDLCKQTGGRYYAADDPKKLPQIFIKEAAVVRKSLIKEDEKGIPISLGIPGPILKDFGSRFPDVSAFVLTTPRERAETQLYTVVDGEKLPVLISWNYGLGKAAAFTSDCTNRWGADWVKWTNYKKFWTNLITWVSRQRIPSNHTITTHVEGNVAHVVVEGLDAKGEPLNFAKLTGSAIDPEVARNGPDGTTFDLSFNMTAPGRYEATFPVTKAGAYAITVIDQSNPKKPNTIVTGLANSYSAEFLHLDADDATLAKMGEIATGSKKESHLKDLSRLMKLDPAASNIFAHDLPPTQQPEDLFWYLLIGALCLFPFDVAVRRLALDPEKFAYWTMAALAPFFGTIREKRRKLQEAAANAMNVKPPDIVPTGEQSREAQSRFEKAGSSAEAQGMDLTPTGQGENKPVVGGTRVSPADQAASDYTRQLLKAKKRAKKDGE